MRRLLPLFLVLLVVAGVLVAWQKRALQSDRLSAPESAAFAILRPGQKVLFAVGGWFSDVGRVMFRRNSIVSENQRLRNGLQEVQNQNDRLRRYKTENDELRALLQLPRPAGGTPRAAQIVSLDATGASQHVFLNIGAQQGVRVKDVVYSSQGVVGQVVASNTKLFPFPTSEVLLLTDRSSGVGAVLARSGAAGVVQGTGGDVCKLDYLPFHTDVRSGDLVLTSGLVVEDGGVFPRGLVIGRIIKIERDKTLSRLIAYVAPAVPLDKITTVWVRTGANS
jgi:rod shape-determining protein MreC